MNKYKNYIIYFIIIILIALIVVIEFNSFYQHRGMNKIEPKAQQGVLDLSNWNFDNEPLLSLNGEWLFFYKQFIDPDRDETLAHGYINVPGLWNSFQHNGGKIGPYAYGTYQLKVLLPKDPQKTFAIKVPDMSSSYRLFVDGNEISANGVVGKSLAEEIPRWRPLVKTLGSKSDHMDIVIHVSNYHHMKGGMWESILLGTEQAIYKNREINLMMSFILVGVLFISVLYYLVIFSVMQSSFASLYLALFCLMAGLRESLIREVIATLLLPDFSFNLLSKLEYITVPSGPLLLALTLYGLYQTELPKKALQIIISVFSVYIIIIIFTPLRVFGHLMNLYLILFIITFIYLLGVITAAAKKKKPGARLLLFGTFFMLLTALIDMGYIYQLHNDYNIAYTFSIGLIVFVLCQMHSLSLSIADIVQRSQNLSKAELAFLQAQIVPHFLYNTLSTIIHLTRESPEKARNLLSELSNYLRGKFNFEIYNKNKFVSLEYELGIVKSYLSIESFRFNNSLEVVYSIDEQTLQSNILPFLIQPLVENAVRHGFKNKTKDWIIVISTFYDQKRLVISVEDNGIGMSREKILAITNGDPIDNGTGLHNVNQRLIATYGTGLSISSTINKGTAITIKIPLRKDQIHVKSNAN